MKSSKISLFLIVLFTAFSAAAQYFYKLASGTLALNFTAVVTNYYIYIGFFLYAAGAVLVLYALKGAELSVAYPFLALSYVWVALISVFLLHETLLLINWVGVGFIAAGLSFIGYGAGHG
ncbi:hypothetical protein HYX10_01555 [Candidatus Woesearchaeota archaeon]|nr:hypothetical protein [Candidatus Woesearchaeota archaeon]